MQLSPAGGIKAWQSLSLLDMELWGNSSLGKGGEQVPKIIRVTPEDDYTLLIELSNHHRIVYDMKPRLQAVRFGGLGDLNKFKAVRVEHENNLVWNGLCQITIDEIINMLEK